MKKSNLKYIGYVNNYDKNRYLEKIWKAAVCLDCYLPYFAYLYQSYSP